MPDFMMVRGFEDVWRPPVRPRRVSPQSILGRWLALPGHQARARLARIAERTPEVMVKVTGRTRDAGHLRAHLDYISRNGQLDLETADGVAISGRAEVADLARGWAAEQLADRRTRAGAPFSHSLVLSMPAGTDPVTLLDAARAFAADVFTARHDYVFTLHTDTPRPHVHLSVRSRGYNGERLNPRKADLDHWRLTFAQALRDRGIAAEATPRRARGLTRKSERMPVRKIQDRHAAGQGEMARTRRDAYREAGRAAFGGDTEPRPWERRTAEQQAKVRSLYLAQAKVLQRSSDPMDRDLGVKVQAFVLAMPQPDSQRLALARELRAAGRTAEPSRSNDERSRER